MAEYFADFDNVEKSERFQNKTSPLAGLGHKTSETSKIRKKHLISL